VLVAHLFAAGGLESTDSERPLAVGGAGQVGVDALAGFDYVALGHLHAPQAVGGEHVRYSGSLLKYAFAEAEHDKGATIVELGAAGVRATHVPITPRHDVIRLTASFEELLGAPRFAAAERAYVEATYTDTGYVLDAAVRLRARFPRLCSARPAQLLAVQAGARPVVQVADDQALLADFWTYVGAPGELDAGHLEAYARALRAARNETQPPALEVVP
jgi:exonuclease SbcD